MFSAFTTQHSEPYKLESSESTSDSQAIFLDSSATRLVPKIAFCSFVNALRECYRANLNLILAMMVTVTLSSKFLLSIEPRYLSSSTTSTGASPSPILNQILDGGDSLIGHWHCQWQKLAKVSQWLPKVHCNSRKKTMECEFF